ncbi:MAG: FHA domain-containing protein [Bdellovibrionales bacterium]|nr:FHA domain-containing protein [Bdellovibrionales bacterium]
MPNPLDIRATSDAAPLLEQIAGAGRGRVFELTIDKVSLGREDSNDIIISDESVSRVHAKIERNSQGTFFISDNNSKNGVIVNGLKTEHVSLNHADIIQLGHFVFRFRIPGQSSSQIKIPIGGHLDLVMENSTGLKPEGNRKRLYLWLGLIAFIAIAIIINNQDSSPPAEIDTLENSQQEKFKPSPIPNLETESAIGIIGLEDPLAETENDLKKKEGTENSLKEAEISFRKGQRDYFNKNYHHAIDNFEAALSISNRHPLAGYYKGLAIHDSEVEAEKNRDMGLKYYNSLQYSRAIYHFKNAIEFLAHTTADNKTANKIIQECERYIGFSNRKQQAAEVVP